MHDNDTASVVWSSGGPFNVTEGGTPRTFTLALATAPTQSVTLNFAMGTGQASVSPTSMTFTPTDWNSPKTLTVRAVDDDIDEPNGMTDTITTTVTSLDAQYNNQFVPVFDVIVDDNDTAGVWSDSAPTEQATEGSLNATWKVRLLSEPVCPVTMNLDMLGTQATVTLPGSGVIVFDATNWDQPQDVEVTPIDDPVAEGIHSDTLRYTLTTIGGCDPLYDGRNVPDVPIEITDNEVAGVALSKTSLVADEGGRTDTYTVVLTSQPAGDVDVVITGDADVVPSAAGDIDTSATTVTLRFTTLTWNVPFVVTATAVDDLIAEGTPHTGVLTSTVSSVSDPAYNTFGATPLTIPNVDVDITDNDQPGVEVMHTNGVTNVVEGSVTDTYLVRLKSVPAGSVTLRAVPDTQLSVSPGSVTFDSSNWNVWQSITAIAVDDQKVEGVHVGYISHVTESSDPFYVGVKGDTLKVDITDNDVAGVSATADDGTIELKEGRSGVCDYVTVVLTAQPSANVTLRIFPDDEPDTTVAPVSGVVFRPETWNIPQRITICAVDDNKAERTEIKQLVMRTFSDDRFYNGATWPSVTVRVLDNDVAVITRHHPLDKRYLTVTRNDRLTGVFSVQLFDRPKAPVRVYIRYPRDLEGTVDSRRGSRARRKFLTFTPRNWRKKQYVRVWYKRGTGGRGARMRTITFRVASRDARYRGIRPRGIRVRILDNNRVRGGSRGSSTARRVPLVAAALPKSAPQSALSLLPAVPTPGWDPAQVTGRRFDMPWAKYDNGTTAKGGVIRIARIVPGTREGYENIDYAAKVVRVQRRKMGSKVRNTTRWVVLQGADRRYYVYEAHLAQSASNLNPPESGAIGVYVFGPSWASWQLEGGDWKAGKDTAIS